MARYKLRPYQKDLIAKVNEAILAGKKSILIQSPTGSGKTVLMAEFQAEAQKKGLRTWFIVHRRELINQTAKTFSKEQVKFGFIYGAHKPDDSHLVQIASVGTLINRLETLTPPDLIIWDEAHHIGAKTWATIYKGHPKATHIGLSATPLRLDGQGLYKWFDHLIHGPEVSRLIENNYLSKYQLFGPPVIPQSFSGLRMRMGDFIPADTLKIMGQQEITGNAILEYKRLLAGKRALVFAISIEHSKQIAKSFKKQGIAAEHIDGSTPAKLRDQILNDFHSGHIKVLSNVSLFIEGLDVPTLDGIIVLRPTCSLTVHLQMCGRVLRPYPGKEKAMILDHAGNCDRLGLPDQPRQWSLNPVNTNENKNRGTKTCPVCNTENLISKTFCVTCHTSFDISKIMRARKYTQIDDDLEEINLQKIKSLWDKRRNIVTLQASLIEIAKARSFSKPLLWANNFIRRKYKLSQLNLDDHGNYRFCFKCGIDQVLKNFHAQSSQCKLCTAKKRRRFYEANKQKEIQSTAAYKAKYPKKVKAFKDKYNKKISLIKKEIRPVFLMEKPNTVVQPKTLTAKPSPPNAWKAHIKSLIEKRKLKRNNQKG